MTDLDSDRALNDARMEKLRQHADLPLLILSLAVIPLVAIEYLTDLGPRAEEGLEITYAVIWFAFVLDYLAELVLAPRKSRYFRDEWLSLVLIVLTVPLPLNPLQILRAARSLRLLRVFQFGAVAARGAQRIFRFPPKREANSQLAVAVATILAITLISAELVLAVEEGARGSQINTMSDSLWWAISTITTVGLGDIVPRTTAGRLLALVPMIAGVTLIATLASNFVERVYGDVSDDLGSKLGTAETRSIERRLDEITKQLADLQSEIARRSSVSDA